MKRKRKRIEKNNYQLINVITDPGINGREEM